MPNSKCVFEFTKLGGVVVAAATMVCTCTHTWHECVDSLPARKHGGQKRTSAWSWFSFYIYGTEVGAVVSSATTFTSLAISAGPHLKFDLMTALWVWGRYLHGEQLGCGLHGKIQVGCPSLFSTFPDKGKLRTQSTRVTVWALIMQPHCSCSAYEIMEILFNMLWQQYLVSFLSNSSTPDTHTNTDSHTNLHQKNITRTDRLNFPFSSPTGLLKCTFDM